MAGPQGIAADVAGDGDVAHLGQGVIDAQVGAGHAHGGRPREHLHRRHRGDGRHRFAAQLGDGGLEHGRRQLADAGQDVLAVQGDALGLQLGFQQGLHLFHHHHFVAQGRQFAALVDGCRAGEAELEHRCLGEGFLDVHVGGAGGDEAEAAVAAGLDHVQGRNLGLGLESGFPLEHQGQAAGGAGGGHHPAGRLLLETGAHMLLTFAHGDQGLDVADAGGEAQDHRHLEALGQLVAELGHLVGFLGIGGLQHRQVGEAAPVAGILLVLGGGEAHVVGHGDHQAAGDAGQGQGHEGVGGHVHAHVLHAAEGAGTGVGRAHRHFQGNFFIHRPLCVEVRIGRNDFQHFRRRRARIGRGNLDAGLPDGAGNGFVAGHEQPALGRHGRDSGHVVSPCFVSGVDKAGDVNRLHTVAS